MDLVRAHVLVCGGAACVSSGCTAVREALEAEIAAKGIGREIKVVVTGCMGPCDLGPIIVVYPEGVLYCNCTPDDAREIVDEHLVKGRIVHRLLYEEPMTSEKVETQEGMTFFSRQERIALRNTGVIDPLEIDEYIARDGYAALGKALTDMTPEEVVNVIKDSGLRGRGGAGFPTGTKWLLTAKAPGSPKYVVCNADEGDPGAFMDRSVLEGDPHAVLEAMTIAGYAIGANQGYIYVRAEYPLAVEHLQHAIGQAREYGLLGKDILGSGFNFDIDLRVGAGAFVCGEETALLASIESRRGEPRPRPPYPAQSGLWGQPTLINNVETYANIAPIILKGAEWFSSIGTEKSKGTKVFALAGKINNTGLVEVPMGTPLGDIIFDIGGGIPNGKKFKAAQTGGPSGGCIPAQYLNTPIDYESLKELGTMMGSGGLIVMDEDTCMVDLAKFFMQFIQDESCGKCAPCRIGTKRMLEILDRITKGQGREGDVELLIELGEQIMATAMCGLGQSAANPVLSTIRYFRDEYDAHIRDHKCPASSCAALFYSPCQNSCPADVDVPRYIALIKERKFAEAAALIRSKNPFPAICGRVCDHPCESKCRRATFDEPVAIKSLKRFAADWEKKHGVSPAAEHKPPTGKRVAIVGAGPAGLSAAYYLALAGHKVTVFEALPVAGGLLAVGIPEYRLPKEILDWEIEVIKKAGVEIRTNTRIGEDVKLDDLASEYDALFIAVGAHNEVKMNVPGEDLEGVMPAVAFLRDVALGEPVKVGKKAAVVGGGNAAIDAARTAKRMGAEEVHILYRRLRADMPADDGEIRAAEEEGIHIHYLTAPTRIIGRDGNVAQIECVRMKLGEFDKSGRRRPIPVEASRTTVDVDTVIPAIGQAVDTSFIAPLSDTRETLFTTKSGLLITDPDSLETSIPGVFAGGDCVTGPWSVVAAIGAGREAAYSIDKFLGGDAWIGAHAEIERSLVGVPIEEECKRCPMPELPISERARNFKEVELGFTEDMAVAEAARCFQCDVREP
ncbi:MAG: NADH-quinone oxidoreductase subunit NuoF [Bacillota bacterium]